MIKKKIKDLINSTVYACLSIFRLEILNYNRPDKSEIYDFVRKIKKEKETLVTNNEGYNIYSFVKSLSKMEGDIAEVGTYKGGSAKLICLAKGNKKLHLFDTFEGLPTPSDIDKGFFRKGEYKSEIEILKEYLNEFNKVYYYKGWFQNTSSLIKNRKFSFVNLDVDLYEGTLFALQFFYGRMNKGGLIVVHDYNAPGIKKAVSNFLKDKKEAVFELPGTQCIIVKI